jgi:DNA-binding beta-propeller fold protein YncE
VGERSLIMAAGVALAAAALGACGSEPPPAAEPPTSPPLERSPAGSSFRVGREPEGLTFDARTGLAAVITRDPSALTLVDPRRGRVTRRVPLPATGRHLGLAGPGGPVLVPVEQADELAEVSLPDGREREIAVGDHPHDVAASAGRLFVGNEFGDSLSVVEGDQAVATLDAPDQPGGVAATAHRVVVVGVRARALEVYDASDLRAVGTAAAGVGPTHVVAANDRAWVADTDGHVILGYSIAGPPRQISTTAVGGSPYALAIDPGRSRLWVGLGDRNELVGFDISGKRPLVRWSYPIARQANSIAVDSRDGSVLVAGRAAGVLEHIEVPR